MVVNFHPLLISSQNLIQIKNNFVQELQKAAQGEQTSIPFLRNPLPPTSSIKEGETFQVMTIGGSVFKSALVKKVRNQTIVTREVKDTLPLFQTDIIFFDFIMQYFNPLVSYLSLNFAHPVQSVIRDGLLDSILIRGGKGNPFDGLVGKLVGKTIEEEIFERYKKNIRVTVANDTLCLFLSEVTKEAWLNTVAGIIGTGTNYAIAYANSIVSLECHSFNKFSSTESGKIVDQESKRPGGALLEKEIAGLYLYKHFNIIAQQKNLPINPLTNTKELSFLAKKNEGNTSKLAQILLERSASFSACVMAGIVEFLSTNQSVIPTKAGIQTKMSNYIDPVSQHGMTPWRGHFVMEGGLFWDGYKYREYLEKYLNMFVETGHAPSLPIFHPARHHSIKGGIKLLTGLS